MKLLHSLKFSAAILSVSIIWGSGCKYDVAEPIWSKPAPVVLVDSVTSVSPAAAIGGVNYITISGVNFSDSASLMAVYFNTTKTEVISSTPTSITVRRPPMNSTGATIKVVAPNTYLAAKFSPYQVTSVDSKLGSFPSTEKLGTVGVDSLENVYVMGETNSLTTFWKITPDGARDVDTLTLNSSPTPGQKKPLDMRLRNGVMYILSNVGNNRNIDKIDLATKVYSRWCQLPGGKPVKTGDFDDNGYFYAGGYHSDLIVIFPNPPASPALTASQYRLAGLYSDVDIMNIRVYNGYVYVAIQAAVFEPVKIWRHSIDASGNLGAQEQVVDLGTIADSSTVKSLAFSADGKMYIVTDGMNPMLVCNLSTKTLDYFYKGIEPSYGIHAEWGFGNYLYMLVGNTTTGDTYDLRKIDMGGGKSN